MLEAALAPRGVNLLRSNLENHRTDTLLAYLADLDAWL